MTLEELQALQSLSPADLLRLRASSPHQDLLAPLEHRAFAREWVGENPLNALPLAAAIPGYQLAKLLGLTQSRSKPSMDQLFGGYQGVLEGLNKRFK